MNADPELLSELTRRGYLQTPTYLLAEVPADKVARHRELWRDSFQGQCKILGAVARKMVDDAVREIGLGSVNKAAHRQIERLLKEAERRGT